MIVLPPNVTASTWGSSNKNADIPTIYRKCKDIHNTEIIVAEDRNI